MKKCVFPILLAVPTVAFAQGPAQPTAWSWSCRVMEPTLPGNTRFGDGYSSVGEVLMNFDRVGDQVFIAIESEKFPHLVARRQLREEGAVTANEPTPASDSGVTVWNVATEGGPRALEVLTHGARNGGGTAIAISSYEMTTIGSLPEDFFSYHAVGLCASMGKNS